MNLGYSSEDRPECVKGAEKFMAYLDEVAKNTGRVMPYHRAANGIYVSWQKLHDPLQVDDYGNAFPLFSKTLVRDWPYGWNLVK